MELIFSKNTHRFFLLGLALKSLNGIAELILGFGMWFSSPVLLNKFASLFAQEELYEDPTDLFMNFLLNLTNHASTNDLDYAGIFLISHGIIKLILIGFLLKGVKKAYPIAIFIFSLFAVYQVVHFLGHNSYLDIFLTIFDLIVIGLTFLEYKRLKNH
ncbi:MAG: DUF2127 domain-containing protein [Candidatus Gracilibacteria bacterium]